MNKIGTEKKVGDFMSRNLDEKGNISILFVIIIFISAIIAMGFVSIGNKVIAINEVQGIMDMTGVIALRNAVNETDWRLEELEVDKSKAISEFQSGVKRSINGNYVGDDTLLKDFKLNSVRVYRSDETKVREKQGKEEYYLEAVGTAIYSTYSFVDRATFHAVNFFDFLVTDDYSSVAVGGTTEDGDVEVIIRTVSKITLQGRE